MRSLSGASLTVAAMLVLSSMAGCARIGQLRGMKAFKAANLAYQQQDYRKAVELYEEAVQADPNLVSAYFFLANSYDNLYKPSRKGDPANDALLAKAVENYQKAGEALTSAKPEDAKLKKLSLEYLVSAYGPDKLNDPAKAEPVVQRMIQIDPGDPGNYFALARIYEDAGVYDEAEKVLLLGKEAKPGDPGVYMALASFYNRQGQFEKTISALEERAAKEPSNPEAFYTLASYYWDEASRDFRLSDNVKKEYIRKGVEASDHAIKLKPDYMEALVFKGLLLRLQANIEKDPKRQQDLLKEAVQLKEKADELRKKKTGAAVP